MMSPAEDVINRVKAGMEDSAGRFFELEDFVRVYNDALDEMSEFTEIQENYIYVKRRKGAAYTDMRGSLPPNFLRVRSVYNPLTNKWLEAMTVREMDDTVGRFWERRTGPTRWWQMRGLWTLGAYPAAGDDVSPLKVYYTALLPHIKIDNSLGDGVLSHTDVPHDFDSAVEYYMMYELLAERKETDKALQFYQRFQQQLPQLKDLAQNRTRRERIARMGAFR